MRKLFPLASGSQAALFGAALLVAAVGTTSGQGDKEPKSDVAVVHMDGVLKNYDKYKKRDAEIAAHQRELSAEIKEKEKELDELMRKRDAYPKGGKDWWDYDKKYQRAAAELDSRAKQARMDIDTLDNELFMTILNDIEGAIREYCRKRSIKVVLWKKEVVLDQPTVTQRVEVLNRINVLYFDEEIDITQEITKMLNAKFAKENGK